MNIKCFKRFIIYLCCFLNLANECIAQNYVLDNTFNCPLDFINNQAGIAGALSTTSGLLIYGDFSDSNYPGMEGICLLNYNGSINNNFSHQGTFFQEGVSRAININNTDIIYYDYTIKAYKASFPGNSIDSMWTNNLYDFSLSTQSTLFLPENAHFNHFFSGVGNPTALHLIKVLQNGIRDSTFTHNTDAIIYKIFDYDSTSSLLAGRFHHYDSLNYNLLCKIDEFGNLDTSFHNIFSSQSQFSNFVWECHVQSDGKIIVAGNFKINSFPDSLGLIRLLPNGELDTTFNNFNRIYEFNLIGGCNTICPTLDGSYLIGGFFTSYQNQTRSHIAKIDSNGFLDTIAFNGFGIDSVPAQWPISPDVTKILRDTANVHRYYVMGSFESYNGLSVKPIIRLDEMNVGLNQIEYQSELSAFPNPTTGIVSINIVNEKIHEISLYDLEGRMIFNQAQNKIDLSQCNPGIYLIKVSLKINQTHFIKVIKL